MLRVKCLIVCLLIAVITPMSVAHSSQPAAVIQQILWSPDGSKIAISGTNGLFYILDAQTKQSVVTIKNKLTRIDTIAWRADGAEIASANAENGLISIWDTSDGSLVAALPLEKYSLGSAMVAWSPDGAKLAGVIFGDNDNTFPVHIWSISNNEFKVVGTSLPNQYFSMVWSPDSTKIALGGFSGVFLLNNISSDSINGSWFGPDLPVFSVAWSRNDDRMAIGGSDGSIRILDAKSATQLDSFHLLKGSLLYMQWSPDDDFIVGNGGESSIYLWNLKLNSLQIQVPVQNSAGLATPSLVSWSPYGGRAAYVTDINFISEDQLLNFLDKRLQFIVAPPSFEILQKIVKRCVLNTQIQNRFATLLQNQQLSVFSREVQQLSSKQISPVCSSDLIAVSNALQNK